MGSKKRITNQDILKLINSGKIHLESKPGTRFSYCNTNYALLALIIEKFRACAIMKRCKNYF